MEMEATMPVAGAPEATDPTAGMDGASSARLATLQPLLQTTRSRPCKTRWATRRSDRMNPQGLLASPRQKPRQIASAGLFMGLSRAAVVKNAPTGGPSSHNPKG